MNDENFFADWDLSYWAYLHGKPAGKATFKHIPQDFVVTETLPFELTGEGENLYILIEKVGLNTQQVCQHIAKVFGRRLRDVGYAGLKDKQSVSRQWFSIQANVTQEIDLSVLNTDQIQVIDSQRHGKKLKIGNLKNNRFDIRLRKVSDFDELSEQLEKVKSLGAPNYFGLQRFGFKGNNLNWANRWAGGETLRDKKIKSFALSAIRSFIFNEIVSVRLKNNNYLAPTAHDVFILSGSNSYFQMSESDDKQDIVERLSQRDIAISVPLVGVADKKNPIALQAFEQEIVEKHAQWLALLIEQKVDELRRPVSLFPEAMIWKQEGDDMLISFELPTGCFATSLLRECVNFREEQNENIAK
jgi:tRNA pseudouridine13 synthase